MIWKRKWLILGGTLLAAVAALVLSLSMPKTYETSRTLRIGQLPGNIESREAVMDGLTDHRVLKKAIEELQLELEPKEMAGLISIDTKSNPHVRYKVQTHDAQDTTRIADWLAEYIIKIHTPIFERRMQITKEYEVMLAAAIRNLEAEIQSMKKVLKTIMEAPQVDAPAVILLQANIEDRGRNLAELRRELKDIRLSRIGYENTAVIAADAPPQHPVKPRVKLNVALAGTLGLLMFTFVAFFLEYLENARRQSRQT